MHKSSIFLGKSPICLLEKVTIFRIFLTRYMMMRRYVDASRTFQDILVFLSKISAVNSLSYQYDQMLKKQDQQKKNGTQGVAHQN